MKAKHKIATIIFAAAALISCDNFFDEKQLDNGNYQPSDIRTSMTYTLTDDDVAGIGKQCTYKGNDTIPSVYEQKALSLCTASDSTPYNEWKRISSLKAFTEEASADLYVPMFMAQKFPYLDAGTICNVTYPLYEGKSSRVEPFNYSTPYTLTEDDYNTIWNGHGALYLNDETEKGIPALLSKAFPLAANGKIIVVTYDYLSDQPDSIIPFLPYACSVGELLQTKETNEHQLTGIVGTVKSVLSGRFYLVDGNDSIYVYGLKDEDGNNIWKAKGIEQGNQITIKGNYSGEQDEPQFVNAVYISHSAGSAAQRRKQLSAAKPIVKKVIYQFTNDVWDVYANEQLTVAEALPQTIYDELGSTTITNADEVIGTYLRAKYLYPQAKQIYLVAYTVSNGIVADEWTFDGTDFIMNTGYVQDIMSFVLKQDWAANISTYYTTPFVNDGPADFNIQHIALDGLNYVWRYQAAYGMTASAYVSGTNHPVEDWLISPNIRLKKSTEPQLTFYHAVRYGNEAYNKQWLNVMVTNNYTGDVSTTEWQHLDFPDSIPDGSNWHFLNAGRFDLSQYNSETIVIAFRYNTTIGELTSAPTWEIQNLIVAEKEEVDAFINEHNEE